MVSYVHVFTPLRIGRLTAKNRVECAPAIPFLASEDYFVTRELDRVVPAHSQRAEPAL